MVKERVQSGQSGLDQALGEAKEGKRGTMLDSIPPRLIMRDAEVVIGPKLQYLSAYHARSRDLFDSSAVSVAIVRERERMEEKYRADKLAGLRNDDEGAGDITVFTTTKGKAKIIDGSRREISSGHFEQIEDNLWGLTLSGGAYRVSHAWGIIVSDGPFESSDDRGLFSLPYGDVVGVIAVGLEDESLWLNMKYNSDGTPKEEEEVKEIILNSEFSNRYSSKEPFDTSF